MDLDNGDMQPVAQPVLSYLASLSNIVHGPGHPIRTVSQSFLPTAGPKRSWLVRATLRSIYSSLGQDCSTESILCAWAQSIGARMMHRLANGRSIRISGEVTRHHRGHDANDFICCIYGTLVTQIGKYWKRKMILCLGVSAIQILIWKIIVV